MTEALVSDDRLTEKPLQKTLEIGTGCGYQTYLLSLFSKKVTTIERIEALKDKAQKTLKELKINNITFKVDDGSNLGDDQYDAILSAAAPLEIPQSLKDRLTIGGKLIIPVGDGNRQVLTLVKRTSKSTYIEEKLEDVLFVPLLKGVVS
jgi:protein-L-isoaspartate(D-aspartate) O-methyltransferase